MYLGSNNGSRYNLLRKIYPRFRNPYNWSQDYYEKEAKKLRLERRRVSNASTIPDEFAVPVLIYPPKFGFLFLYVNPNTTKPPPLPLSLLDTQTQRPQNRKRPL